jgi:hypothetical protein
MEKSKVCTKCGIDKPYSHYAKDSRALSGTQSSCKSCQAAWNVANKDKKKATWDAYKEKHKEAIAAKNAALYQKNKETYLLVKKQWYQNNKGRKNFLTAKRRAQMLKATPQWDEELNELVLSEAYKLAKLRENVTGIKWHVDHIVPLQGKTVCGLHVWNNVQVITAAENQKKLNTWPT